MSEVNCTSNQTKIVLYADDDADDKVWLAEACKAVNSFLQLKFVENGKDIFTYLKNAEPNKLPSLIVLDLNMPEFDGRQTLKSLKANPSYQKIPVAVVTTSSSKIDLDVCQRLGASAFLTKPNSYSEWKEIIQRLEKHAAQ